MGPPPFGDGKAGLICPHVPPLGASMGPPPFGDGKGNATLGSWRRVAASMGPPPFGDGKGDAEIADTDKLVMLQWGHRLSAMESLQGRRRLLGRQSSFNGATAFRRWKGRPLVG